MKKIIVFLFILQVNCLFGQTKDNDSSFGFVLMDSVFIKGEFLYEVNQLQFPADIQNITLKFKKATEENREWFQEYYNKYYKPGEGLPYNEKFGVTEEEYNKIKNLQKVPPKLLPISLQKISVKRKDGKLNFEGEGEFKIFDLIEIDLVSKTVKFDEEIIPYSSVINASSTTPFGSWHGYSWSVENTNQQDNIKFDELTYKTVKFNIGKTLTDNKTLLILTYKEIEKGKVNASLDMYGYIK